MRGGVGGTSVYTEFYPKDCIRVSSLHSTGRTIVIRY